MKRTTAAATVRIDMVRCVGHGICAHVLADEVQLDPWGFPVVDPTPLDDSRLIRRARRAARACPRRALLVETAPAP
jgi:ferredoxin